MENVVFYKQKERKKEGESEVRQRIRIHKAETNKGAADFSHLLDAPAGKHGFVRVKDGHFYFEDGTRIRFLGFNMAARSNTPNHETAEKLAARFASMGVNVIRLHAADAPIGEEPCTWSSCKEAPLLDYERGNSLEFNKAGLDRFDYFVAKLKEKGIYLHIDLLVARAFNKEDGIEYSDRVDSCTKCFPMINERLIELQKDYARKLLLHVNPYTGLALADDPAVITVQINNEESAIKGTAELEHVEHMKPYRQEVQRKFNHFLLMKYDTREKLKEAWTFDGVSALQEDENPEDCSVRITEGDFVQPVNDPMGSWEGMNSPARYADYMEFGIFINREFYQMMKSYLHSIGVKVPINTSNLLGGAADVYGHSDADVMENNSYFNHPLLPVQGTTFMVSGPMEYVSTNPLTIQKGAGAIATTIPSMGATAIIKGKPFMLSEWNEYGLHPFHSTAAVQTVACACLNDWDGLILYNYQTSEKWDDQPADEILSVFDAYNDPAVACQWGFMASVFLKGLVAVSDKKVDVVYTQDDLKTLPNGHGMLTTMLPYITGMRNVFLDGGERYTGDADAAINAGFLNGADLSEAKKGVYYAWSPYRDAMRRYPDKNRLTFAARDTKEIQPGIHLGEKTLVFDKIEKIAGDGDYREFAEILDQAFKKWGIVPKDAGLVDGKMISVTKEMIFDMADMSGQLALGLMANVVGQLTYFYTDKVGLAVGGVGIVMAIAKVIDALTDIWFGNVIEHSKGGNSKFYKWMFRMMIPAAVITFLMFTVPKGQTIGMIYVLVTNVLLTAVIYTMIATPFGAVMVVRTNSQVERSNMGIFRAVGNYGAGMIISIIIIPVTNMLGGTQSAWIKFGAILALIVLLLLAICYNNGRKAKYSEDTETLNEVEEEEAVPFKDAIKMLFGNKYWVIVLLFNIITNVTNAIAAASGTYYCKWIFGNDNLVAITGIAGLAATLLGFVLAKPIISKLGIKKTVYFGVLGQAITCVVRCVVPTNFMACTVMSLIGSLVQIPLMCLYGVLLAMAVDYNEWKYDKKLVAVSSGAIGFGSKVGGGLGSIILSVFLAIGAYDATLEVATTSMRYAIYGFSNYLPLVMNLLMFFVFTKFDLEEKLPKMRAEVEARRKGQNN